MNAVILALLALFANCAPDRAPTPPTPTPVIAPAPEPTTPPAHSTKPPCEGAIVATTPGAPMDCDVIPPQRLDVWYPGSDAIEQDHFQLDCDDTGGTLVWDVTHDQFVCMDVDY